jgi:hypothetical protein
MGRMMMAEIKNLKKVNVMGGNSLTVAFPTT